MGFYNFEPPNASLNRFTLLYIPMRFWFTDEKRLIERCLLQDKKAWDSGLRWGESCASLPSRLVSSGYYAAADLCHAIRD